MIRMAIPADGERLAGIYAPAVTERATSFELIAPDAGEMARRVSTLTTRTPWLVLEEAGRVMGYAYASPHRDRPAYQWSVEVSAYIDAAAHRAGYGRALYAALFDILTAQGFANAYAGITLPNPASVGVPQRDGIRGDRRVSRGRLQVRPVARRDLAAPATGTQARRGRAAPPARRGAGYPATSLKRTSAATSSCGTTRCL